MHKIIFVNACWSFLYALFIVQKKRFLEMLLIVKFYLIERQKNTITLFSTDVN